MKCSAQAVQEGQTFALSFEFVVQVHLSNVYDGHETSWELFPVLY